MAYGGGFGVTPGMGGILVTCNKGKEAQCVKEVYDLLSLYFEDHPEYDQNREQEHQHTELEDALLQEVNELKSKRNKKYLSISVGKDIGCLAFIKLSPGIDPVKVAAGILGGTIPCTRSTQRLVPVQATCYANISDFTKMAKQVVKEHFTSTLPTTHTFAIVIESRMNSSLNKRVIIELVGDLMAGTGYAVDLKHPKVVIMVQVLKSVCGISVIPGYHEMHRMNVQTACDRQLSNV